MIFIVLLLACSATETDTGEMITGQVQNSNLDSLGNVLIIMRYPLNGGSGLRKSAAHSPALMESDSTISDLHGRFSFKKPQTAEVFLEFAASETLAAFIDVRLDPQSEENVTLDSVTCTPPGRIEGRIDTLKVTDTGHLYIMELDLIIPVDVNGYFITRSIPSGTYFLRTIKNNIIIPSYLDTIDISVSSNGTSGLEFSSDSVLFASNQQSIALWSFNQQQSNAIFDLTLNNVDLIIHNSYKIEPGLYSNCINLQDSAYCVVDSSLLLKQDRIDVEAVIYINKLPQNAEPSLAMIVSLADFDAIGEYGYELRIADSIGHLEFITGTKDGWQSVVSANILQTQRWYTIRGVFDGTSLSIFVDGKNWGSLNYQGVIQYTDKCVFTIGKRYLDRPFYFNGKIDEIRISTPNN
jgi:hypothetical protein